MPSQAAASSPLVYVGQRDHGLIDVVDAGSGELVRAINVSLLGGVVLKGSSDARRVYAIGFTGTGARVSVVDAVAQAEMTTLPLPGDNARGMALSSDGARLYVALSNGRLASFDTGTLGAGPSLDLGADSFLGRMALSPDGRLAYVLAQSASNPGLPGRVLVVDLQSGSVVAALPVGVDPEHLALSPDGRRLLVSNLQGDSVSVVDTGSRTVVATLSVGARPAGLAFTPDGRRAYVACFVSAFHGRLDVIDLATNQVTGNIFLNGRNGPTEVGITPDGTRAFVSHEVDLSVSVIAVATGAVIKTVAIGTPTQGVAVSAEPALGYRFYAGERDHGVIDVADAASGQLVRTVGVSLLGSIVLAGSPDARRLYAIGYTGTASRVSVVDTVALVEQATLPLPGDNPRGIAVSRDGARLFVSLSNGKLVSFDTATLAAGASFDLGADNFLGRFALSADGHWAYVLTQSASSPSSAGRLLVVDLASGSIAAVIPVGLDPANLALSPDGTRLLVSNRESDSVSVIDTAARAVVATVAVGARPAGLAFTPDGRRAYLACRIAAFQGRLDVIDLASNQVASSIFLGGRNGPSEVGITPDGTRAYFSHEADRVLSAVDLITGQLLTPTPIGTPTLGLAAGTLPVYGRRLGDITRDGRIDRADVERLTADLNKPVGLSACGLRCDLDGDGMITVLDARRLVLLCDAAGCALH